MNIVVPIGAALGVLCLLAFAFPAFAGPADLSGALRQMSRTHPRLFFTADDETALRDRIQADPLLDGIYQRLQTASDAILERPPVTRIKTGKRLLSVSRTALQRITCLAFTYRLTGSEAHLRRAQQEMLAAAAFEDWNPSHFLDVAEMTAALAIGYDWLYDDLDPDARATIQIAIIEKGLETSFPGEWWVDTTNNWNQVCHGGLVLGALAVYEETPCLAERVIARAIDKLPNAMDEYAPDGVYPEGPTYWRYGTTYNVLLLDALESALGTDFGLASAPGFTQSAEFYLQATGPTGLFFNFSDCGTRSGPCPAIHWFAAHTHNPALLWHDRQKIERFLAQDPPAPKSLDRLLPFLLVWTPGIAEPPAPQRLNWKGDGHTPVAMHRTAWTGQATFAAIKGGSPGTNHAHMDAGSFVIDAAGLRWALDLGAQGYYSLESRGVDLWNRSQDSQRWTVFRLNNFSHNTLVVDGQLQQVAGHAPIIAFSGQPGVAHTIVDLTPVYEGQLQHLHRGLQLLDTSVLVQDELRTLDHPTSVRWGMATHAQVELASLSTATLRQDGQAATLRILAPDTAAFTVLDMENPPHDYDAKNPDTRMVAFEINIPASTDQTLAVLFEPGATPHEAPDIRPLDEWSAASAAPVAPPETP